MHLFKITFFKCYIAIVCAVIFTGNIFAQSTFNLSPEMFGGKADAVVLKNCTMNIDSKMLICADAKFSFTDINKIIFVNYAGASGATLISSIDSVIDERTIRLKNSSCSSVNNLMATYGTDCTEAFIKMNAEARQAKYKTVSILFQHGTYLTKFNNWLAGIKNVEVNGNGASLMCTMGAYDPNGFAAANVTLYMPTVFDNVDNHYYNNKWAANTSYGFKINAANTLDKSVTLQIKDSIMNFKQGNWVMLYGFEEENVGGFPPDARYFEFLKIKNVDTSTGKIIFTSAIKNTYDSGWPDSTWSGGLKGISAPRIINCNRATFNIIDNLIIKDLNLVSFPGWKGNLATEERNGRFQLYGVINAKITSLNATALYVGTSKKVVFENSNISATAEPDKEAENLTFEHCNIHTIIGARGIDTLRLLNSFFSGYFTVSPRVLYINGCSFNSKASGSSSALAHVGFNGGTDFIQIGTNIWNCSDEKRSYLFGPGGVTDLTVERVLDKNTITVSNSNWSDARNGRQVVPGKTGYTASGKSFKVERVYQFQKGIIAIKGIFSSAPAEGEVFIFSFLPKVEVTGSQVMQGAYKNNYTIFADKKIIKNAE